MFEAFKNVIFFLNICLAVLGVLVATRGLLTAAHRLLYLWHAGFSCGAQPQ